jgi:hypothetical protein
MALPPTPQPRSAERRGSAARRPRGSLLASAALLAACALATAGCGSSGSTGASIDPAKAVPASAPLYASAVVRPDGSLQIAARKAGRALTHQADPYLRLLAALQTPGSPTLDFQRDLAPWLGSNAGVFLSSSAGSTEQAAERLLALVQRGLLGQGSTASAFPFAAHTVEGAFLLDTRDTAKARSFLRTLAGRAGAHTTSYRGTSYQTSASGIAFGIVARLVAIGTEGAVREVIDTAGGGPSLASAPEYAKLLASAPSGALAHVYANAGALAKPVAGSGSKGAASAIPLLAGGGPVNISLIPSASSIALDADTLSEGTTAAPQGLLSPSPEASRVLGELPGESWLAVGLANVGETLGADVRALKGLTSLAAPPSESGEGGSPAVSGLSVNGLIGGILSPLEVLGAESAEAKRDFSSWMGSAGLFASGSGLLELKGGVVIDSKDPARSRAAVAKLAAKLRAKGGSVAAASIAGTDAAATARLSGLPVELDIAAGRDSSGHDKFVIGIGEASVQAILNPSSPLSGAAPYGVASSALGESIQPSVIADFPTLLGLLEGVGLNEDPSIAPLVPYLQSLSTLSAGGKSLGGGVERFRLVLGLQAGTG